MGNGSIKAPKMYEDLRDSDIKIEEKEKIRIGREEKFKELEEKKRIEAEKRATVAKKDGSKMEELSGEKVMDMRNVKEGRKSPKPKAVEQYENLVSSKIKGDQKYDNNVT